ncbi:hypothetical protein B5M09_010066, partial [Aphanomyces astaci]
SVAPLRPPTAYWAVDSQDIVDDLVVTPPRYDDHKTLMSEEHETGTLVVEEGRAAGRVSKAVVIEYIGAIGGWWSMIVMVLLMLAVEAIKQISSVLVYALRGAKKLFSEMLHSILEAPMLFFDANPIGRVLNRFGDDVLQVDMFIPFAFAPILIRIASIGSKIVTTIAITQWMGLLVLPLMAVYGFLGSYFLAPLREVNRMKKTMQSPLLCLVSEGVDGSTTIRAFGPKYLRRFNRIHDDLLEAFVGAGFVAAVSNQWFALRVELISCTIVFALLMGVVVMHDAISAGLIALVITYGLGIPANLAGLVNVWARMETALIAPDRLYEYIQLTKEGERHTPLDAASTSWPTHRQVQFDQVSYRYKPTAPLVLQDVSFTVKGGEKVGVVGRTGAGKSSLMMSLFRMNDLAAGHIRIDGLDIADMGLHNLRSHLAIIPQNPVQLADRIGADPDMLLGPVEENGENFSVGERQMLCMARALLRQATIVILDEATAAIDHDTDQLLQQVVRSEFATSTVLTIAHRLDTVLDCDRILVFDQGRLVQNDTPAALVNAGTGIFFDLVTEGGYSLEKQL